MIYQKYVKYSRNMKMNRIIFLYGQILINLEYQRHISVTPVLHISIDGHKIDETDHTKVLDSKLTWKHPISYITGKIAEAIWVIVKVRKLLDKDTLITLYYVFIWLILFSIDLFTNELKTYAEFE